MSNPYEMTDEEWRSVATEYPRTRAYVGAGMCAMLARYGYVLAAARGDTDQPGAVY